MTQVITPFGDGQLIHNRLTHSEKVAQVARSIAQRLLARKEDHATLRQLGGLDLHVCEAAALAHDLGHPPFGHIGEVALDRIARGPAPVKGERFSFTKGHGLGLPDGFEGNAQTLRVVSLGKTRSLQYEGLDLTFATLAGIAKYPWGRAAERKDDHRNAMENDATYRLQWSKFNAYAGQVPLLETARSFLKDRLGDHVQSLEASVMDVADDISYAIHDLEDFYLADMLDTAVVIEDLKSLRDNLLTNPLAISRSNNFLRLSSKLERDYPSYYDKTLLRNACGQVVAYLEDGFTVATARGDFREAAARSTASNLVGFCVDAIILSTQPLWTSGPHIGLSRERWHEVQMLKAITKAYVVDRSDVALLQRGQQNLLVSLIELLVSWADDQEDKDRLPRALRRELQIAEEQDEAWSAGSSFEVAATYEQIVGYDADHNAPRGGRYRVILDYVCSLGDQQCVTLFQELSGAQIHRVGETFR